ncbi:DUF4230 domain-containing protein [Egbenema bharatensis]|uniref:DUF4230 domain-containing protein n=1 Tax=Egbenema bharatensis TaxID=3463334 RepID=UPI003A8382DC
MTSFAGLPKIAQGTAEFVAKNIIGAVISSLIVVVLVLYAVNHFSHHIYTVTTKEDVTTLLISSVEDAHELVTATTENRATVVINKEAKLLKIPVGDTNLIYEGVGRVQAAINLEEAEVKALDAEHHNIYVLLPAPYISDVSLNVNKSSTLANYRKWFGTQVGPELYDQAQRKAIAQIREEACANNILKVASRNAEAQIRTILSKAAFQTIQVESQTVPTRTCPFS